MPQLAAITINDGATTPVAHTFNPVVATQGRSRVADRSPGVPSGYLTIDHEVRQPGSPDAAFRVIMGFNIPVTAVVDGSTQVVRNSSAQIQINLSQESTLQERKDLLAYMANYLANTTVKDTVYNIEPFY